MQSENVTQAIRNALEDGEWHYVLSLAHHLDITPEEANRAWLKEHPDADPIASERLSEQVSQGRRIITRRAVRYLLRRGEIEAQREGQKVTAVRRAIASAKGATMGATALETTNRAALAQRSEFAQAANEAAAQSAFADYRSRRAANTLRRQDAELANFGAYFGAEDLGTNPGAWDGVTWGIVEGFAKRMLVEGYAIGTVNNHLSTVKTYAKLAAKAGALTVQELAMIRMVSGYSHKEGQRIDDKRDAAGMDTRIGDKKADFRALTEAQEAALVAQCNDSAQGLRDRAMLVLLLDLGLRVSEAADLQAEHFDAESGKLTVYRRKTDTTTTFELRNGKLAAMRAYFDATEPEGQLLSGSRKGGALVGGMSTRAIRARASALGEAAGIDDLSPHDLRHTRATRLAPMLNIREMMDWFGWNSAAMPARYIAASQHITVE